MGEIAGENGSQRMRIDMRSTHRKNRVLLFLCAHQAQCDGGVVGCEREAGPRGGAGPGPPAGGRTRTRLAEALAPRAGWHLGRAGWRAPKTKKCFTVKNKNKNKKENQPQKGPTHETLSTFIRIRNAHTLMRALRA